MKYAIITYCLACTLVILLAGSNHAGPGSSRLTDDANRPAQMTAPDKAEPNKLTLITATPDKGFDLAVQLSRMGVTRTQPDTDVLHTLREHYARDADALIAASHVIAVHYQTIAEANNYWRD